MDIIVIENTCCAAFSCTYTACISNLQTLIIITIIQQLSIIIFTDNTAYIRQTRNCTIITYSSLQFTCFGILANNTTYIGCSISCNIYTACICRAINSSTILPNNATKICRIIIRITVIGIRCLYIQCNTGNSISNNTTFFINTSYTTNIFITSNAAAVDKVSISCRNCTSIAACNAANILFASNRSRAVIYEVSQFRTGCIIANHTANVISTGNCAVVASVGYAAAVAANQAANIITNAVFSSIIFIFYIAIIYTGNTCCIHDITYNASFPFLTDIIAFIFANNAANVIAAAYNTFIIRTVQITFVNADYTANITAAAISAVSYAKAVNILYFACINTNDTAKACISASV